MIKNKKACAIFVCALCAALLFCGCSAPAAPAQSSAAAQSSAPAESSIPAESSAPADTSAATATDESLQKIKDAGKLIMLTNAEFPPYEYLGDNNEVQGIDVDLSKAIADELGVELEVVNMDFDGLIPALIGGKGDMVAAGMTVTPERQQAVDFSTPYAQAQQAIIIMKDNNDIAGEEDLKGKIVGVQLGTTGDLYVDGNIETKELKQYKSGLDAANDLMNGRLDAVVLDVLPALSIVAANDVLTTVQMPSADDEEYAVAVVKGSQGLLDAINQAIEKLQADNTMGEIALKHMEAFSN